MNNLWEKLSIFQVGTGNEELSFVSRLARENDWSKAYAQRVYEEYLKFLYLACSSGQQVTPSDEVDQAWHLHLCYSDSYWNDLCGSILGKKLHHGPTKGGQREDHRFLNQYEATLELYQQTFGHDAPPDIWPPSSIRFSTRRRFVRVDLGDSFVIRKRSLHLLGLFIASTLILTGCGRYLSDKGEGGVLSLILVFIGIGAIVWIILKINGGGKGGGNGCGSFGSGCNNSGCSNSGCSSGCGGGGCGGGCGGGS